MFHYIDGAADDEVTLQRNTEAFDRWALIPRYLVDVEDVDLSTTVLGQRLAWPVALSPTGMSRLFHHTGEQAAARAAERAGTLYGLSTVSSFSIEEVAAASDGPKMFQIYVLRDAALNDELMDRCREAGYAALCLTIDVPVAGNRERDVRTGMTIPPRLTLRSLFDIARRPAWVFHHLTSPPLLLSNVAHRIDEGSASASTLVKYIHRQFDPSVTWDDAARMVKRWGGPFAVKGVLSVEDARCAVDIGATAVIVSNHGGRQLDGGPATVDVLPEIVEAVGDRVEVILDGGIRRGSHVVKALALGARACMVGRPYLYGLGAGGEAGVDRALEILRTEVERTFRLVGITSVADLGPDFVRRADRPSRGANDLRP